MEDGRAIANYILSSNDAVEFDLTNLKINKLIYLIHGWYLARKGVPLIRNHIEAWQYGPVVRAVFDSFRMYRRSPILGKATYFDYSLNAEIECKISTPAFFDQKLIDSIINYYIKYNASELVEITHRIGSPWHDVYFSNAENRRIRDRIPNEVISDYFVKIGGGSRSH